MYRHVLACALSEWDVKPTEIDGLFAMPAGIAVGSTPEFFTHQKLAEDLGIEPVVAETINAGGATYSIMVQRAAAIISAGLAEAVLCVGAGKFPDVGSGAGASMARIVTDPDFEFIYGPFIPAIYALAASQYLTEYGRTHEDLASVAVSARRWALRSKDAVMKSRGELTVTDVLESRPIAAPFHLLDCSFPCEGGGAVLVTSGARARELTSQPAYVLGMGEVHTHSSISQARSLVHSGAAQSGAAAFKRSGLGPDDIDVAELYDAFTINPLILLEDLGFCDRGGAGEFVRSGATDPGGRLPMNTNGGLLSFGHTGDASGLSVLVEGTRQIMGTAGDAQVEGAETALVHTYGGMMGEHATLILGRTG
jgi:acetyl-CoA acetyltransferase